MTTLSRMPWHSPDHRETCGTRRWTSRFRKNRVNLEPAKGLEHFPGRFRKWLTANEFWSKSFIRSRFQLLIYSPRVDMRQRESTGLVETFWRRSDAEHLPTAIGSVGALLNGQHGDHAFISAARDWRPDHIAGVLGAGSRRALST